MFEGISLSFQIKRAFAGLVTVIVIRWTFPPSLTQIVPRQHYLLPLTDERKYETKTKRKRDACLCESGWNTHAERVAPVNNMSIPALQRTRDPLVLLLTCLSTFLPSHMEALIESVLIQMVWNGTKIRTYIQNKIQNKKEKKKRFRNAGGLIIPKSAGLFLINLDDVLVLHPQLSRAQNRNTFRLVVMTRGVVYTTCLPFNWLSC